jgi:hypothetical protein
VANHPSSGPGENYGTPSQYVGPSVPALAPNVNPSAEGANTETGGGVNPQGPAPHVGDSTAAGREGVYPDTTVGSR